MRKEGLLLFDDPLVASRIRAANRHGGSLQLLKWIGNKQRMAAEIASYFPSSFHTYYEPFLGSGAILGFLEPRAAVASDNFSQLMEIWNTLKDSPETLKRSYEERWLTIDVYGKKDAYRRILESYNRNPNGADLLFLCRACYGGVVRFRQADGYMSTPCGVHEPISPASFAKRVEIWTSRIAHTEFQVCDFEEVMLKAKSDDLIYCDPPYSFSQTILYGAQGFDLRRLFAVIEECKRRGVYVALSIDGSKKSGNCLCDVPIPLNLFEREVAVNCGRSMLKRFQMNGKSLEGEIVADRLLLTY